MKASAQLRSAVYLLLVCLIVVVPAATTNALGAPYHAVTGTVNYGGLSY